ncbi:hypothetical protein MTYM_00606 [Methylococcales bacterium]|nr:hypothetical protein MTYM_00606 [Methylococcales bacterium]
MTPRQIWPPEADGHRKHAWQLAQQCVRVADAAAKRIEAKQIAEALIQLADLQNQARQIELAMESARVDAKRWGRTANDLRAKARRVAHQIVVETEVIKRKVKEEQFVEALLDLAQEKGHSIEVQVLLVNALLPPK